METQARYTWVGLFTLVIVIAGFTFVYWLHSASSTGALASYRIRFEGPVVGMRTGLPVLFNGLRVGEVTAVGFDPGAPDIVMARIAVGAATPVRSDTRVGVDSLGLMGSAAVSLTGGASTIPIKPDANGEPPLLIAGADETKSMAGSAKAALARLEGILAEDAKPLRGLIDNIATFSSALGRNSDKVDGIFAGLEKMTGSGKPPPTPSYYNLTADRLSTPPASSDKALTTQIALPEPTALVVFETQKILIAPTPGELKPLEEGQWADSIPRLVQAKLVDSLENAGFAHVAKAMDGFTPDVQLLLEIRAFQIIPGADPTARIEIYAKWLGADGKIADQRSFEATASATAVTGPAAAAALNAAFQKIARDIVAWARTSV